MATWLASQAADSTSPGSNSKFCKVHKSPPFRLLTKQNKLVFSMWSPILVLNHKISQVIKFSSISQWVLRLLCGAGLRDFSSIFWHEKLTWLPIRYIFNTVSISGRYCIQKSRKLLGIIDNAESNSAASMITRSFLVIKIAL